MEGFKRRKEQKKNNIRQAALELFQAFGFKKVSMSEIARRAGVSPVTIYNHFGSKQELIRDVVKSLSQSTLEKFKAVIRSEKPFVEKLETIILSKTEIANQFQGELLQSIIQNDPEMQRYFESIWQGEVNQIMSDFFEQGRKENYISPELSDEAISAYFDILRCGIRTSTSGPLLEHNPNLVRDLIFLMTYGLNG